MYTQAFCGDSFAVVSGSTAVNNRSNFASEFGDRLDDVQPHHRRRLQQQQQQQRSTSSPAADDGQRTQQRRSLSQDCDVDLSPADVDDNDSTQVQTKLFTELIYAY